MSIFADKGNYSTIPALLKSAPGLQILQVSHTYSDLEQFQNGRIVQPYLESCHVMLIPRADVYNSYEKLLFAFDKTTWILLILTFSLGLLMISCINWLTTSTQKLLFGNKVQMNFIDILSIIFGIAQNRQPRSFCGRIILLSSLFFCFMIRSLYQGKD